MIRLAVPSDLPRLLEIYATARAYMRRTGNPTQWGGNHPTPEILAEDIALERLYAVEAPNAGICGCFMLAPGPDPTYAHIFSGTWGSDLPYGVLHRVASDGTQRGILSQCVAFAARRFCYLRIDTHEKNIPMQRALAREGFIHRGTILTDNGTPRLAYDRSLSDIIRTRL